MPEETPIGPLGRTREHVRRILHHALEEEVALSATLRDILGHLTGPNAYSLCRLFGDHCRQIDQWLAEISDRARACGIASETARPAAGAGRHAGEIPPRHAVGELLGLHERIAQHLRADLAEGPPDPATTSLLGRLVDFHETTAWMLRMVLDGPEVPPSPV